MPPHNASTSGYADPVSKDRLRHRQRRWYWWRCRHKRGGRHEDGDSSHVLSAYRMMFHRMMYHRMIFHCMMFYCMMFHRMIFHCMMFYCMMFHRMIFHCMMFYCRRIGLRIRLGVGVGVAIGLLLCFNTPSFAQNAETAKLIDSLIARIQQANKTTLKETDPDKAVKEVSRTIEKIKALKPAPDRLREAYLEAGEFFGSRGRNELAYRANEEALRITASMPDKTPEQLGRVERNLGEYARRMANISLSQKHFRKAMALLASSGKPDYELLYLSYNAMGGVMWYAAKTDSAEHYFEAARDALEKMDTTPLNKYYRMALVYNNLAGLYNLQGKTSEAIRAMEECITRVRSFLAEKEPYSQKSSATSLQFEAIDNLAGIYKELGNYTKARDLLLYSYQQKQKELAAGDPGLFISQILIGQLYYAMREYDKALTYLSAGIKDIEKESEDYLFWYGDAFYGSALVYDEKKNIKQAAACYEKADSLYSASFQGEYDNIYLEFLRNTALFYAENGLPRQAMAKAHKGYNYVIKAEGENSQLPFFHLQNLSEVYFKCKKYKEAASYGRQALENVNQRIRSGKTLLDSVQIELKKPRAILLTAQARYELLDKKGEPQLLELLKELNEAIAILDRRKAVIYDPENIQLLMADHKDLLEFMKKLTLELYGLTGNKKYMYQLVGLHESGIYNRIRLRLNRENGIRFSQIPDSVRNREQALRKNILTSLETDKTHAEKMQHYLSATAGWDAYQEMLKKKYPKYYQMRYAPMIRPVEDIQKNIPAGTTLVRYFFTDKKLLAFVADDRHTSLYTLDSTGLREQLGVLSDHWMDARKTGEALHTLYSKLWKPLASSIANKKVIIIPDGILYHISFEALTSKQINRFEALAANSLLRDYTISYDYSLLLINADPSPSPEKQFVAFAPGFSDAIKASYLKELKDPLQLDHTYLSLLPLPFSDNLTREMKKIIGGISFTGNTSTAQAFKANAGGHKIIHIATHAEANNLHPEYSRLIFAKDASGVEDNSLYLYEIYNCDMRSDLSVLTACESGRPGYEDGEGMISLAHAFNYAGSQSILTALWKIDEQSCAAITEQFYKNLLTGLPKDEALRAAKLSYLENAHGRTLSPQYWAGLVVMGDPAPIELDSSPSRLTRIAAWTIGSLLLIAGALFFFKRRRARSSYEVSGVGCEVSGVSCEA